MFGVLVTKKHGPFVLRREYVVVDSQQRGDGSSNRRALLCLTAESDRRRFRSSLAVAVLATPPRRPTWSFVPPRRPQGTLERSTS